MESFFHLFCLTNPALASGQAGKGEGDREGGRLCGTKFVHFMAVVDAS
jgi:hypothetical protein